MTTTKKPAAPTTAAEAQALADALLAEEREAAERTKARRAAARLAKAYDLLETYVDDELTDAVNAAALAHDNAVDQTPLDFAKIMDTRAVLIAATHAHWQAGKHLVEHEIWHGMGRPMQEHAGAAASRKYWRALPQFSPTDAYRFTPNGDSLFDRLATNAANLAGMNALNHINALLAEAEDKAAAES